MPMIEAKLRKWGHSLGVIIPKEILKQQNVKENQTVRIILMNESPPVLKKWFGIAKGKIRKSGQQIKDEIRAELYPDD